MTVDEFYWVLARVSGLSAYAALAIALLTGVAMRTAVLDFVGGNRVMRSVHEFTTVLWVPLAALHVVTLLLDATARIGVIDVFVPFREGYGTVAIGVGSLAVDVLLAVTVAAYLRRRMRRDVWTWLHRLAYAGFALVFLHAVLSGTDFSDPAVSAITWGTAAALLTLTLARVLGGRLPA